MLQSEIWYIHPEEEAKRERENNLSYFTLYLTLVCFVLCKLHLLKVKYNVYIRY